jgi:predicted acylesterase/phospholipase RssA
MSPLHLRRLNFFDIFTIDFWRNLLRVSSLFFPAIIFLAGAYMCFWKLTQGKDLMLITLENRNVFGYFIVAIIFWSYITWYTSRVVAKAKEFEQPDENEIWQNLRIHGPRLLAFSCFTVIILAFFQLPAYGPKLPTWLCNILLLAGIFYYFFIWRAWEKFLKKRLTGNAETDKKILQSIRVTTYVILVASLIVVVIFKIFLGLIVFLLGLQIGLVLLLSVRRKKIELRGDSTSQKTVEEKTFAPGTKLKDKFNRIVLDKEDRAYFNGFLIISTIALIIYVLTVFNVQFSVHIGSFPFVFLAFGVLLILGNFVAIVSVLTRFNFHLLFFLLAVLIGLRFEPHYTKLNDKKNVQANFDNRQHLKEYFLTRLLQLVPNPDSAKNKVPLYFVLANGGASRSGYWTASVLAKMEDLSKENFSKHLFCLSGASGGSVGNAAFFSILRSKNQIEKSDTAFLKEAKTYLKSDFLTYTIARMLGPDVFRHIIPLKAIDDRASALAHALENAAGKDSFIDDSMSCRFSEFITQKNNANYNLPILCINTTRMQDGSPGVFSTIDISDSYFNKRVDVLDLLSEEKDIKLSTAVVLGASFPYLSPAGRFDHKVELEKRKADGSRDSTDESQYFVDGGYFDNSGAGVVNEMIIAMNEMLLKDSAFAKYKGNLEFYVLNIANDPVGESLLSKVNPLVNDLAAPVKTLMGAYGSQTAVNDRRLENYMHNFYGNDTHYIKLNLYVPHDPMTFSMNWVISKRTLDSMDVRLQKLQSINPILERLKQ